VRDRGDRKRERGGGKGETEREEREREKDDEISKGRAASEGVWEQKTICKARLRPSLICLLSCLSPLCLSSLLQLFACSSN
jgi:hypothetical protein